jgi:hypothetical protein
MHISHLLTEGCPVVLLRDGEWFWLCVCGWQSPPSPTLALVTTGHLCGSGERPGDGTWLAAPVPFADPPEVLVYASRPEYRRFMERGWFIV